MEKIPNMQLFLLRVHPSVGYIHDMQNGLSNGMDKTLPKTALKTQAEIDFYKHVKTTCDALRVGDRIEFCEVAVREIERCNARIAILNSHMKRFSRRSQDKAKGKIPVNA